MGRMCAFRIARYFLIGVAIFTSSHVLAVEDDTNPFVEAAKVLLQDQLQNKGGNGVSSGLAAVGGLVQNFMQSDGGRQISDALFSATKSNSGADVTSDLISGIGSLLASAGSESNSNGGLDPQLIGTVVNMFASQMNNGDEDSNNNVDVNNNEKESGKSKRATKEDNSAVDWGSILSLAGNFIANQQGHASGESSGLEGVMNLLPLLMQSGQGEQKNTENIGKKPSVFQPVVDLIYDYWIHFTKSEFGQTLWKTSGLEATAKLFTDENGKFDLDRIYRSLENASFRKRWIKNLSKYVADWVSHVSDPATQTRFLQTAQFMGNSFLKAQGYPKSALFDPTKPSESLTRLVNTVFKRQFNLKIDAGTYLKPAVSYLQEVYQLGQSQGLSFSHLSSKEVENKLTDTINSEIIEPALRVWRAYRHVVKEPKCDKYVICFVNKRENNELNTGLKPGVTKITSMIASWFISGSTGSSFWDLYYAATEDHDCQVKYPADCEDFHTEDHKATTEYAHSEL